MKYDVMKTDAFMRFYGSEFFNALAGHPECVTGAYMRALWAYWSTKCEGLRNDKRFLRDICHADDSTWPDIEQSLFGSDGFFRLIAGRWHQKRCREEWQSLADYKERNSKQAKARANARWHPSE